MSNNAEIENALAQLALLADDFTIKDGHRVRREIRQIRELLLESASSQANDSCDSKNAAIEKKSVALLNFAETATTRMLEKQQARYTIDFPEALPVSAEAKNIEQLIDDNQVVILAGETGSGKTTQLPKICLKMGRGKRGLIGHTQPRRIAASSVAQRLSEELAVTLGDVVGYQVRFKDNSSPQTHIKLMTDGVLLAEIQSDPLLFKYDTLIIDEAHERSLNIDFLMGYIKRILPKRPDLKLIITSATIDLEKFSAHFNNAPIKEVSGRTYPVDIHYRPWQDQFQDVSEAIVDCVNDIVTSNPRDGDILIFLSGERDIRETSKLLKRKGPSHLDILPLYARLSLAEQSRVFSTGARQRVVLATNVAETSITVPGIKYVIDPGTARISRYNLRTKIQRLPIEAISQASANQRSGRSGRVMNGVCYRLYEEDDFLQRPEFSDPEIVRTNLAAVILQMLALKVGDIRQFPFVDKPDSKAFNDGLKLLEEIGAVSKKGALTPVGRQVQKLPVDPKLGRILMAAADNNCLEQALTIVTAISIPDPRERPQEKQQQSDEKHRRFWDDASDFVAFLNLWEYAEEQRQALTQNQFRKLCQKEFLNFLRLREWRELHTQVKLALKQAGINQTRATETNNYDALHKSILTGFISQIGQKSVEKGAKDYLGTRNKKFFIFPGSSQTKKQPKWVVAAEYIETSQIFAHQVAAIQPEWVLQVAPYLIKDHFFEPYYDIKSGQVKAYVRKTFLGLTLVEKQRVNFSHVDEALAREIFIRSALVEGAYRGKGRFYKKNLHVIDSVQDLEAKSRRRDILVDDEQIYAFYNTKVPENIVNLAGFEHWRQELEKDQPDYLLLSQGELMLHAANGVTESQFPAEIPVGRLALPVKYCFEPGKDNDGVNVRVPVSALHHLEQQPLEWLVPGLLRDKCIALVKSLPKHLRKQWVPVPQFVDQALAKMPYRKGDLFESLSAALCVQRHQNIEPADWNRDALEDFYHANIQIVDENKRVIDQSRSLDALKQKYKARVQQTIQDAGNAFEREGLTTWDFGHVEETVSFKQGGLDVTGFAGLQDRQSSVALKVFDNPKEAQFEHYAGCLRLAALCLQDTVKYLKKHLFKKGTDVLLSVVPKANKAKMIDDVILMAVGQACFDIRKPIRQKAAFDAAIENGRADVVEYAQKIEQSLISSLKLWVDYKKTVKSSKNALLIAHCVADINQQLERLIPVGRLVTIPYSWLIAYPRYFQAVIKRLEKVAQNPQKDKVTTAQIDTLWQKHQVKLAAEGQSAFALNQEWQEYRWLIEELRVSLFAQTLKTMKPVSEKRLKKLWDDILA